MDNRLLGKFDRLVEKKRYPNRSEAIRDLVRNAIVEDEWHSRKGEIIGVFVLVYDHHKRELSSKLLEKEHNWAGEILSTLHLHLDHDNCLEAKVIRGDLKEVQNLCDELASMKGVKFGKLIPATSGKELL